MYNNSSRSVDYKGFVDVYTDGCCLNNGKKNAKAGIGVWFGDGDELNVSKPLYGPQTNNRAEIKAVTIAAKRAQMVGIEKLRIHTDSQYLYNCMDSWMDKWRSNGWKTSKGGHVLNKWMLIKMDEALSELDDYCLNLVPAHSGIYGNEMADKLARQGALMQ